MMQNAVRQNKTIRMTTALSYDRLNRLTGVSSTPAAVNQLPLSFQYSHNDANQRIRVGLHDGSYWLYEYDALGQVQSGKRYWADGTPVAGQQYEYAHDDIGNRTETEAGGDSTGGNLRTAEYGANSLNQYTNRTVPGYVDVLGIGTAAAAVTVNGTGAYRRGEYFHVALPVDNSSAAQYPSIVIQAVAGANSASSTGRVFLAKTPETFVHDADGNLTQDGRWAYTWDGENRLVTMEALSAVPAAAKLRVEFEYDWRGRRIGKTVKAWSGSTYTNVYILKFLYDGWNLVAELDANNVLVRSYLWGTDMSGSFQGAGGVGGLLAVNVATNGVHFPAYDGNGNIAGLVSAASGATSARFEYGPFAEPIRVSGPIAEAMPLRFSTKFQDDETDLLYYGYRYYNASSGRWLSRDPLGEKGGLNLYGFVYNNPPNLVDKDGRIAPILVVAAIIGVYFCTEEYVNAPGPSDPTYSGLTGDNILAFADLGVVLSTKLVQGLSKCLCKPVCSRLVPGGGLGAHEAAGGHTLATHVPQATATGAQVQAALAARLASDASIPAASAFASRAVAEKAVVEALEANQGAICAWLSGGKASFLIIEHTAASPVGYTMARGASAMSSASKVLVRIEKMPPQSGMCFRVKTAYPK